MNHLQSVGGENPIESACHLAGGEYFAMPECDDTSMIQLIDPAGKQCAECDHQLDSATLRQRVIEMAKIRRFDQECTALQRKGQLGLWVPLLGQEAVQVGAFHALTPNDHVFPSHRDHGVGYLMGVEIAQLVGVWRGSHMGDWDSEKLRFHLYSMVIGAHCLHGVGYAMGQAKDAEKSGNAEVSVVFHGDGAISEGDVNEAYTFATVYQAPVVFICVNNQWAISEPTHRQSIVPLYQRARGYGMPGIRVDGNDVLAMEAVTAQAIERARRGDGPSMIEAYTYRMGAHTTSDDPTKYRQGEECELWKRKDPIQRIKNWLIHHEAWSADDERSLEKELEDFAVHIRDLVENITPAKCDDIFEFVYSQPTPDLIAEREALRQEMR